MTRIRHFSLLIIMFWRRCLKVIKIAQVSSLEQGCLTCRIETKTETQKGQPTTEAKSVEPLQKDVDNLLVTISFSLDE